MPRLLELSSFKDARGSLTVIEKILPFQIRRVYYIYDTNTHPRAGHKHREGQQALICLHSQCRVHVRKENSHQDFLLSSPHQGLILDPEDWHTVHFEPHCILLVLASTYYSADNYLYD